MRVRLPWLTLTGAAVALALSSSPALSVLLQWDRAALAQGEWWRLLTGHFPHWTADHLIWDVLAFVVCGVIVERHSRRLFAVVLLASALVVGVAMLLFLPGLANYRGLSGIDAALFGAALITMITRARAAGSALAGVLLGAAGIGLVLKTVAELISGEALFVAADPGFEVVPLAHAMGATVGIAATVWFSRVSPSRCGAPSGCGAV